MAQSTTILIIGQEGSLGDLNAGDRMEVQVNTQTQVVVSITVKAEAEAVTETGIITSGDL